MSNRGKQSGGKAKTNDEVDFLLKTVDELNEKNTRLESKFRDVTTAYKSLLAEKQALEITIKALKTKTTVLPQVAKPPSSSTNLADTSMSSRSSLSEHEASDAESASGSTVASLADIAEKSNLEEKVAALTSNIQLLLENKSRMEQSYQAEKKKLRADLDELKKKNEISRADADKSVESYELKLKELRASLKQSQTERDKLMQELNSSVKTKSDDQESKIFAMQEEHQGLLFTIRNENNDLRLKSKNLSKQFENKCEELIQSEKQLKRLRALYEQLKIDSDGQLANLRDQLNELTDSSQRRIADLENKISELCATIATHENNSGLLNAKAASASTYLNRIISEDDLLELKSGRSKNFLPTNNESPADFDAAIEQISALKAYIESTAKALNINFNFNEIWLQTSAANAKQEQQQLVDLRAQLDKLKEDNRNIKEEYEKYKIRTNYLMKSAKQTSKELSSNYEAEQQHQQQIKQLSGEAGALRARIAFLEKEKVEEARQASEVREKALSEAQDEARKHLDKCMREKDGALRDLERELVKQRDRTVKLLAEKEAELCELREHASPTRTPRSPRSERNYHTQQDDSTVKSPADMHEISTDHPVTHTNNGSNEEKTSLFTGSSYSVTNSENNSSLLHFSQQNAFKDTEMSKLRVAKAELEYKLKQTIDEHSVDVDRLQAQIKLLKQEIERIKLNQSRYELNGTNLEYVKNVVYNLITAKDESVRASMITAIMQILQFTKSERCRIQLILNPNKTAV